MNSTVRGLSGYDGGMFGIEIDEKEAALSLRNNVSERPIQFVKDNLTEFGEKNAKIFKFDIDHIEQNSSDEGDYSVLKESDLYNFSIPMTDRNYSGESAKLRENTPLGLRILHWKNNPLVDPILDRNATPNALNPNVSSVHLYDNLYGRIRSIQNFYTRTEGKIYDKIVVDSLSTDFDNYTKNGIAKNEFIPFLSNTKDGLTALFNGSNTKLGRVNNSYNAKVKTHYTVSFTLQDIIDDFYRLGYRSIVIVDIGCRDLCRYIDEPPESAEESARIQEQSKLNLKNSAFANDAFGTKRHRKGNITKMKKKKKKKKTYRRK
jgi:arsenate reductase-like glutaredoxin family protein